MPELETLGREDWEAFVGAPSAVLMLGKSDCPACAKWTAELTEWLAGEGARYGDVRFGKLLLDTPGLGGFKRAHPWVTKLDVLPFTVIFRGGGKVKEFAGGGAARLQARLERLRDPV